MLFREISNDPKNTWILINSLMGRKNKSNPIKEIKSYGQTITNNDNLAETFNGFFINLGPKLASDVTRISPITYLKPPDSNLRPFILHTVYFR